MNRRSLLIALTFSISALWSPFSSARADDGVLVFGGTGQLGAEIVIRLVDRGETVSVFVRPTSTRARLEGMDVSYVIGDLMNAEDVSAAIIDKSYRVIIDATAKAMTSTDETFYETALRNITGPAHASGVQQVIHHGSVSAGDNMKEFPGLETQISADMLQRLEDKGVAETVLMESGVPYTIIRNGFIDPDNPPAMMRARMTEDQSVFGRIGRADLAELTLQCLDKTECLGKIYHAIDDGLPLPFPIGTAGTADTPE